MCRIVAQGFRIRREKIMNTVTATNRYNFAPLTNEIIGRGISEFVVTDIETTGFGDGARIVEVAAVKFRNNEVYQVFDTFINPKIHIPSAAVAVHGIRDEDVANAPIIEEIMPMYCNFLDNYALVGHNISFDLGFLTRYEGERLVNRPIYDTLLLARKYVKDVPNHKLETLINAFDIITEKRHRAKDDSIATGELFLKLLEIAKNS